MLIQPSQADVRRFFCAVYAKSRDGLPLEAIETIASLWIAEHPEYHEALGDVEAALRAMGTPDPTNANPFLHLSMHLSISEQCSIDQPRGIRQAVATAGRPPRRPARRPPRRHGMPGRDAVGKPALRPPARRQCLHRRRAAPRYAGLSWLATLFVASHHLFALGKAESGRKKARRSGPVTGSGRAFSENATAARS
jgi:hypothetical protein